MSAQKLELTWYNKDRALIPTERGRYGYTWVDPRDPRYCETHYLEMGETVVGSQAEKVDGTTYSERADLTPQEDNLLILGESGDVLEALTRVPELKAKYLGKVKCVYIDPPFNTAQTFANYEDNLEHSVWLTMMRDRLVHLRNLLSEDGSIWVHLDDVENHRMRMLLDEVFGAENFVAEVVWQKGVHVRNDSNGFSSDNDFIVIYSKSDTPKINKLSATLEMKSRYSSPDGDPNPWQSIASGAPTKGNKQHASVFGIQHPITGEMIYPAKKNCWRNSHKNMLRIMRGWADYVEGEFTEEERLNRERVCGPGVEIDEKILPLVIRNFGNESVAKAKRVHQYGPWPEFFFTGKDATGGLRKKGYIPQDFGRVPATVWSEVGHNDGAKREIQAMFPSTTPFATPKPERLLERIIHIATNPGDIVLDVFAGSGTTAAVAQKMGRRWVTCELVEDTFTRFTRPRLEKVIRGEDMGGISTSKGERVDATEDGLPEGMTADEAQKFTSALNKLLKDNDALKKDPTVKALKELAKTAKSPDTVNWRGGGAFTVAKLSPTCFDYDPEVGYTMLTPEATGEVLCRSMAAHLGFFISDENSYFVGKRNRELLCVVEGVLDNKKVDDIMANLPSNHSAVIAATVLNEGVREHVRSFKNGSRVVAMPLDLFPFDYDHEEN